MESTGTASNRTGTLGAAFTLSLSLAIGVACGGSQATAVDRLETLPSWGDGAAELAITVPSGFAVRSKKGSDFDVHYITPDGGDPRAAHGTIYVGHAPNLFHKQKADEVSNLASETVPHDGEKVEVWSFHTQQVNFHHEAVLKSVFRYSPKPEVAALRVHVACGGTSSEAVDRLWKSLLTVKAK